MAELFLQIKVLINTYFKLIAAVRALSISRATAIDKVSFLGIALDRTTTLDVVDSAAQ